jgi:hypothetical protein
VSSIFERPEAAPDGPLSEREIRSLRRLLSDPFNYPMEFWAAVKAHLSDDPPDLTYNDIAGFSSGALIAAPAIPQFSDQIDVTAANTDIAGPGANPHTLWLNNPNGGGSLRRIGTKFAHLGSTLTIRNFETTTNPISLLHGAGPITDFAEITTRDGATLVLAPGESVTLMYTGDWTEVSRDVAPPASGLASTLVTRTTPVALTGGTEQNLGWQNEIRDDFAGWSAGQNHIIVPSAGLYLATADLLFSGGTGATIASGLFMYRYNSATVLQEVLARAFAYSLNAGASAAAVFLAAAADKIYVNGISGASGTIESYEGRFAVTKLA